MSEISRVVVLVPAFNEEKSIGNVVERITSLGLPVVVIDDGSSDSTAALAWDAGASVVSLPFNLGVGGALRCGFKWALRNGYDTVVQCDADGQHDPDQIRKLLDFASQNDLALAIGSRFLGESHFQSTVLRRIPMRLMARIASNSAGSTLTDATSGFRVIARPLLDIFALSFPSHYLGDTFDATVSAARSGYPIGELAVSMNEREFGTSSASNSRAILYLVRSMFVLAFGSRKLPPSSRRVS